MRTATRLLAVLAIAAAAMVPVAARAATPQPPNCPLWTHPAPKQYPLAMRDGTQLVARDPYGGTLARNRLFFNFSVSGTPAALAKVARVDWRLDGDLKRSDDRRPFTWFGLSSAKTRIAPGDHVVSVTVFSAAGLTASTEFALGATGCQPAEFGAALADPANPKSGTQMWWLASFEGPATAPPLRSVEALAHTNVAASLPASVRGRAVGTLKIRPANSAVERRYVLRAPRHGTTLLRRGALRVVLQPGAKRMLIITGLPALTRDVHVDLSGPGRRLIATVHRCKAANAVGVIRSADTTVRTQPYGGRLVC
jgi:hypothetical protein